MLVDNMVIRKWMAAKLDICKWMIAKLIICYLMVYDISR